MTISRPSEDEMCAGGLFDIGRPEGNDAPSWIVGDVFLTNVYAVFRANPPVVGFAQLTSELSRPSELHHTFYSHTDVYIQAAHLRGRRIPPGALIGRAVSRSAGLRRA